MTYPNVPITQTPDWVRRAGQAINYLLNTPGGGGTTTNAATFNNGGAGAASGATFNGSAAVTISYNTVGAQPLDGTLTALAAVNWSAGTQVLTLTAADTFTLKTVGTAAGNILDKAAGDALYQPLDSTLTAVAAYNTNGLLTQTAPDTFTGRTITAGNGITVTNGSGVAGNPIIAIAAGTSFPGSPSSGDRFFRTDRGIDYYYDGTRWLSTTLYSVEITPTDNILPASVSTTLRAANPMWNKYDIYILRLFSQSYLTTGTTNTNYFTFQGGTSTGASGSNVGSALSSQNDAQNTWVGHETTINSVATSSVNLLSLTASRVGAATAYLLGVFEYRLIG